MNDSEAQSRRRTLRQPFWLLTGYSVIPVKLLELPDVFPKVVPQSIPLLSFYYRRLCCCEIFQTNSNWILSRQIKDDHVSERGLKCLSAPIPWYLWGESEDSFPFIHFVLLGPKHYQRQLKVAPVMAQMTSIAEVILICINSVLYQSKYAASL